jgi:hypothetical protein
MTSAKAHTRSMLSTWDKVKAPLTAAVALLGIVATFGDWHRAKVYVAERNQNRYAAQEAQTSNRFLLAELQCVNSNSRPEDFVATIPACQQAAAQGIIAVRTKEWDALTELGIAQSRDPRAIVPAMLPAAEAPVFRMRDQREHGARL